MEGMDLSSGNWLYYWHVSTWPGDQGSGQKILSGGKF